MLLLVGVRTEEFRNPDTYALSCFFLEGWGLVGEDLYRADGLVHQCRTLVLSRVCEVLISVSIFGALRIRHCKQEQKILIFN